MGSFYVVGAAVLWSTAGILIKKISIEPLMIVFCRSLVAGMVLLPFSNYRSLRFSKELLGYIISFTWLVCAFVSATKLTAAANAIMLQYTAPLFIFIFGLFFGREKRYSQNVIPLCLILIGIICFLSEPVKGSSLIGNLIGISSGAAFAIMTILLRRLNSLGMALISISNIAAAIIILPFLENISGLADISSGTWMILLYLGAFQLGLSYVLYVRGLKEMTPLRATILSLTEALLNPIWVMAFLGEVPSVYAVIGSIFILGAVISDVLLKQVHDSKGDFPKENSLNEHFSK
jgi:drug/metabolite transporter (DMT)-like permease